MHHADGLEQLLARRALEQVALRAGLYRAEDALVGVEGCEDNHLRLWVRRADGSQRRHTIQLGQLQVEQDDIWTQRRGPFDRLRTAGRLADDLEVGLSLQHRAQALADDRVVVGYQNANRHDCERVNG